MDSLTRKGHAPGAVALRAALPSGSWTGRSAADVAIRAERCVSALDMRERLRTLTDNEWLVLLTDRAPADLGAGLLAHVDGGRIRSVDVWESVLGQFRATQLATSLVRAPRAREIAEGLLKATPLGGMWPAASGGVLTREHAIDSVIQAALDIDVDGLDDITVLAWTFAPEALTRVEALRATAGDALADACLARLAETFGPAADVVRPLLGSGLMADVAALGVAVDALTDDPSMTADQRVEVRVSRTRLEHHWGGARPGDEAMRAFGTVTRTAMTRLLAATEARRHGAERALDRADGLLRTEGATPFAVRSDLLPSAHGLRAQALGRALSALDAGGSLADVEAAWAAVAAHVLTARFRADNEALGAAVQLARWLGRAPGAPLDAAAADSGAALAHHARAHLDEGGWVDAAINSASAGVDAAVDSVAARGVEDVVHRAVARRNADAREFAAALAAATAAGLTAFGDPTQRVIPIEAVLDQVVAPVLRDSGDRGVLFVLLDGMSVASATTIVDDAINRLGWQESTVPGLSQSDAEPVRRAGAIAALPTLTTISRASLFTGQITAGDQRVERDGFASFADRSLKCAARLFHKAAVDRTRRGWAVASDVAAAIADVTGTPLVGIVLNTIDDALDRSDPGGATWNAESVKHLEPLLRAAEHAGRTVILTGDHGHIVELRDGRHLRPATPTTSNRSRDGGDLTSAEDEVLVEGPRVVSPDQRAVLAVTDGVRYEALKAGYHGGAHPAEVVVPVVVLQPAAEEVDPALLLPPQEPRWWARPEVEAARSAPTVPPAPARRSRRTSRMEEGPSLFDLAPQDAPAPVTASSLGEAVVTSETYQRQRDLAPRFSVRRAGVARLIDEFIATPDARLPAVAAAQALGVPKPRLRGAQAQVQQVLNVEGYPVLRSDSDGQTLVLDVDLLCEQFGVTRER
ncbi:MAG: BREX-2 system phosphatase PglZ [Mobilicoccus sp.]|nr:BREX-2 system phosphatase PglZ [Mobilicoccus sp.]